MAAAGLGGRGGRDFLRSGDFPDLVLRLAGRAAGAAAEGSPGAVTAAGVPAEACAGGQSGCLQAAAEGPATLVRRPAAPAARQDRGAEPPGRHLANGPGSRPATEALPA